MIQAKIFAWIFQWFEDNQHNILQPKFSISTQKLDDVMVGEYNEEIIEKAIIQIRK